MNDSMLYIQALAPDASVKFSPYTQRWYVSARIDIGDGEMLHGITEHHETADAAVEAFFTRLTEVSLDEYLATEYQGYRREWRWNGAAFAECTRAKALQAGARSTGSVM